MAELKIEKVTEDSPLKAKVQRIYIKSFPLFERVSLEPFFNSARSEKTSITTSFILRSMKINEEKASAATSCLPSLKMPVVRPSS